MNYEHVSVLTRGHGQVFTCAFSTPLASNARYTTSLIILSPEKEVEVIKIAKSHSGNGVRALTESCLSCVYGSYALDDTLN